MTELNPILISLTSSRKQNSHSLNADAGKNPQVNSGTPGKRGIGFAAVLAGGAPQAVLVGLDVRHERPV